MKHAKRVVWWGLFTAKWLLILAVAALLLAVVGLLVLRAAAASANQWREFLSDMGFALLFVGVVLVAIIAIDNAYDALKKWSER